MWVTILHKKVEEFFTSSDSFRSPQGKQKKNIINSVRMYKLPYELPINWRLRNSGSFKKNPEMFVIKTENPVSTGNENIHRSAGKNSNNQL